MSDATTTATIRDQIVEEGYAFLPGLLDRDEVAAVRSEALAALGSHGWLAEGSDPADGLAGATPRFWSDESWWPGYEALIGLESFNRLAHAPALQQVMRSIVGDDLFVMPMKIARVTWPGSAYPTPPHQDFFFVRGAADVITAWVPLGDCPPTMGGLRVLPGSHREGLRRVRAVSGTAATAVEAEVSEADPRWTPPRDYRMGDVLIFHSLTVHWAPPHEGVDPRLRISADFRYQSSSDPIIASVLLPHEYGRGPIRPWYELTQSWSTTEWIDPPHPVRISTWRPDPDAVPPSRLLDD